MEGWLVRGNGDRICKLSAVVCFTGTATLLPVWTGEYDRRLQATATRHEVGLTEHRAVVRQFRTLVNTSLPAASTVTVVHTHSSEHLSTLHWQQQVQYQLFTRTVQNTCQHFTASSKYSTSCSHAQFRTLVNTSLPVASMVTAVHTHSSFSISLYCRRIHKDKIFGLLNFLWDLKFSQHWILKFGFYRMCRRVVW
jgi:hypothetical protein